VSAASVKRARLGWGTRRRRRLEEGGKNEEEVKESRSLLLGFHPFVAYPAYI
jgi:hypothetical protein